MGVASSNLTSDEIYCYRRAPYRELATQEEGLVWLKIHDALPSPVDGRPLIPLDATAAVIYAIRNPLDVVVSFAHHLHRSLDVTLDLLATNTFGLAVTATGVPPQLPQQLLTWSEHVASWVDAKGLRIHVVRYEDMHSAPLQTFAVAMRFAGYGDDPARTQRALDLVSFPVLQRQEREQGFSERDPKAASFFRSGKIGSWINVLTPKQVNRVIDAHGPMMRRVQQFARICIDLH